LFLIVIIIFILLNGIYHIDKNIYHKNKQLILVSFLYSLILFFSIFYAIYLTMLLAFDSISNKKKSMKYSNEKYMNLLKYELFVRSFDRLKKVRKIFDLGDNRVRFAFFFFLILLFSFLFSFFNQNHFDFFIHFCVFFIWLIILFHIHLRS